MTAAPQTQDLPLTDAQLQQWERDGYMIAPALFSEEDVAIIRDFFDRFATAGEPVPDSWIPSLDPADADDPLKRYPRVMQPHRWNEMCKRYLIDPRIGAVLRQLIGCMPLATQSMYYYKPPGAKGQAFHQDNFYLEVQPDTCYAAWVAIDPVTPENGGLWVAPGTHKMDVVCPEEADAETSFSRHLVEPPTGVKPVPTRMQPGDVLFFNGSLIHGSQPNAHPSLWRRSYICHYMPELSDRISEAYLPAIDFEGQEVHREPTGGGGPCGGAVKISSYAR